jgi:hypothetical protein
MFYTPFRQLPQHSLRYSKEVKATKFQLLGIRSKETGLKGNLLLTRPPKAVLMAYSKIPLK